MLENNIPNVWLNKTSYNNKYSQQKNIKISQQYNNRQFFLKKLVILNYFKIIWDKVFIQVTEIVSFE